MSHLSFGSLTKVARTWSTAQVTADTITQQKGDYVVWNARILLFQIFWVDTEKYVSDVYFSCVSTVGIDDE